VMPSALGLLPTGGEQVREKCYERRHKEGRFGADRECVVVRRW
jgi:hypothetical protein